MSHTTEELLLLYELSLNLGQSLDPGATCRRFLKTLLSRRNLSAASLWWRDEGVDQGLNLLEAIPRGQFDRTCVPLTPAVKQVLQGGQAHRFAAGTALYAELVSHAAQSSAVCAVFPLGEEGLLLLESADCDQFSSRFLGQLRGVVDNLANGIRGGRAHALLQARTAQLDASRGLLQTIIDTVPLRVFWKDRQSRYLGCNPVFARDAGKQGPADLIGRDDFAMAWAEQAERYRADDRKVMESGQPWLNYEEPRTTPDGHQTWVRTSKVPLRDRLGQVIGVLGVFVDITQQKREARRLALAMDASKILVWEIDFSTGRLDYDGSGLRSLGLDEAGAPDTLPGWLARVHPDDLARFTALVQQALQPADELGFDCEYRFQAAEEEYLWLHSVGRVLHRGAAGQPLLGAGYTVNVDARKRAELALKASEQAQGSLIAALPDVIMRFDREGRHLFVSENVVTAVPLPAADFIGKTHHELGFPAAMCTFWEDAIRQPFETGKAYETEFTIDGPQGTRAFNWRLTPDFDDRGQVRSVLAIARDITASKNAQRALQQRDRYQRALLDSFPFVVWLKDTESRFLAVNSKFVEQFGARSADDLVGRTDYDIAPANLADGYRADDRAVLATGQQKNVEEEFVDARGVHQWIETYKSPVELDGKLLGTVGFFRDITQRKQTEHELERHRQHLEELVKERTADLLEAKVAAEAASRAKSTFLATMSHELRTPMTGVMGMIELAKRRMRDPKGLDQLDKAQSAANRLLSVLNDILDLSRIEAERMVLEEQPLQLADTVDNLVATLGHRASAKGIRLVVDLAPALGRAAFQGDPLRLGQILLNLVGNAIKFTERGEAVLRVATVGESAEAVQVRFEVSDTGIGIDAQAQARLFRSFEQADNSMARKYGGSGLGLVICKRLVQLMGGELGVHSTPGVGSTFWFVVPLRRRASAADPAAPTSTALTAADRLLAEHAGTRVLLAEDEPINQEVSRGLLEAVGLVVDAAADGQQALALAKQTSYALILMDMQMPLMNGVEATKAIRADSLNRRTPILAMTANAFDEDREVCLAAGMNEHISKPVDPDQLYESLLRWSQRPAE